MLWVNSADGVLMIFLFFFFTFSRKVGFDISCKLSPTKETICMKCQILLPKKNKKKKYSKMSSAAALPSMLNV